MSCLFFSECAVIFHSFTLTNETKWIQETYTTYNRELQLQSLYNLQVQHFIKKILSSSLFCFFICTFLLFAKLSICFWSKTLQNWDFSSYFCYSKANSLFLCAPKKHLLPLMAIKNMSSWFMLPCNFLLSLTFFGESSKVTGYCFVQQHARLYSTLILIKSKFLLCT